MQQYVIIMSTKYLSSICIGIIDGFFFFETNREKKHIDHFA